GFIMFITLDHTVIYSMDHEKASSEFSDVIYLSCGKISSAGYAFLSVRVNAELSIYFKDRDSINLEQHMAFNVDKRTFKKIIKRLKENKIAFGNSPFDRENERVDHDYAPQQLYWLIRHVRLFELMTYVGFYLKLHP